MTLGKTSFFNQLNTNKMGSARLIIESLTNQLKLKTEECSRHYHELLRRPFKIKASANTVDTSNHPELTNKITDSLNNKNRLKVRVKINDGFVNCTVIGRSDSHNANFGKEEEGQVFIGLLEGDTADGKYFFNDMIEFQSCDVSQLLF